MEKVESFLACQQASANDIKATPAILPNIIPVDSVSEPFSNTETTAVGIISKAILLSIQELLIWLRVISFFYKLVLFMMTIRLNA